MRDALACCEASPYEVPPRGSTAPGEGGQVIGSRDLVEEARAAAEAKDERRLRELAAEALGGRALAALEATRLGIWLRDANLFDLADALFARAGEIEPDEAHPRHERALGLAMQGRSREASTLLASVLRDRPDEVRSALQLVRLHYLLGERAEAENVVRGVPITAANLRQVRHLRAFGEFVAEFSPERAEDLIAEVSRRYRPCDHHEVMAELVAAKRAGAPYALLRLGDGEGSQTRLDLLDEARFAELYADNRRQFYEIWFGTAADAYADRFDEEARKLPRVMAEADMLGLPIPNWIRHEYAIGSPRGISTLVNIYRFLARDCAGPGSRQTCAQMIHIDLGKADFFRDYLQGQAIGLISCFPQLPDQLRRAYGVASVEFYKLPGEQSFKHIIGEDAAAGFHYPDVFERVMGDLVGEHRGKIFLIAGGILGKLYAGQIRRHGGIAIDIGSLADAWVRKATRPGYEHLKHLALG